ncbi:MAG: pyridoxal-phosphate dependent enzyme [bacterium]|nr:pyridoxal-phosphate dependent enzyme [Candidatus Sumerlaeota bacterium]
MTKTSDATSSGFVPGPTYDEMLAPGLLKPALREAALAARAGELNPLNLFNISWAGADGRVRHVVLPPEFTGVKANIIVLLGLGFPSGSHKVGPAYSTLAESEVEGRVKPGMVMVGPSTGNFGIGVAYISRLKGYESLVIMPDSMSTERYERIRKYGGRLDLTPGTESDVILVLERVEEIRRDPRNFILAQFELLPNYRFHRHVTGGACLEAAAGAGNGRVAAFVSAPGSAGTLAAGDAIKAVFPGALTVAVEPVECSTLFNNGRGTHRIEGIGDKMVTLIHNVAATDYVMMVHDDDTVRGLRLVCDATPAVRRMFGAAYDCYRDIFGISSICNILGAIRTARLLGLGGGENVVTIATDGFDRYPSVMDDLARRVGGTITESMLDDWHESIYRACDPALMLDVRPRAQQERLFLQKEETWMRFNYTREYLDSMKSRDFWEVEYAKIPAMNAAIAEMRGDI